MNPGQTDGVSSESKLNHAVASMGLNSGCPKRRVTLRVNQKLMLDKQKFDNDQAKSRLHQGQEYPPTSLSSSLIQLKGGWGRPGSDSNNCEPRVGLGVSRADCNGIQSSSLQQSMDNRPIQRTCQSHMTSQSVTRPRIQCHPDHNTSLRYTNSLPNTMYALHSNASSPACNSLVLNHSNSSLAGEGGVPFSASNSLASHEGGSTRGYEDDDRSSTTNSASEIDDILADINELEPIDVSNTEELSTIDPHITQQLLSLTDQLEGQPVWSSKKSLKVSSSCPTNLAPQPAPYRGGRKREEPPPVMTEEERRQWEKDRIKKDNHNIIEKRRRYKINDCIQELAKLLPSSYDLDLQNKKGMILEATVDYIRRLQLDQDRLAEMSRRHASLERNNEKLLLEIQQLQSAMNSEHSNSSSVSQSSSSILPIQPISDKCLSLNNEVKATDSTINYGQILAMDLAPSVEFQETLAPSVEYQETNHDRNPENSYFDHATTNNIFWRDDCDFGVMDCGLEDELVGKFIEDNAEYIAADYFGLSSEDFCNNGLEIAQY